MDDLKIEVGKFYKTRCGDKAKIYEIFDTYYNGAISFDGSKNWTALAWIKGSNQAIDLNSRYNIVSEWTEPHPAESWEVDKKILVSEDGKNWHKRYFSHFKDENIYVFDNGKTSWTQRETVVYRYAKPAEE